MIQVVWMHAVHEIIDDINHALLKRTGTVRHWGAPKSAENTDGVKNFGENDNVR